MKTLMTLALAALTFYAGAQSRFFTKTGTISFSAGTAIEDIDGVNKSVTSVFDATTGQIEFALLVKGFEFKRGLMQEHFNENYMESEKYPKAVFKGKFEDVSSINFKKDGTYTTKVKGMLEIHNVKKEVEVPATITIVNGVISAAATFKIALADYNISIPGPVKDKISPTAEIKVHGDYKALEAK